MNGVNVFISYSREDQKHASGLLRALQATGINAYSYLHTPAPLGSDYPSVIASAIAHAHFVVVLWGGNSDHSAWIRQEILYAQHQGKIILPVLLVDDAAVPPEIVRLQAVAAFDDPSGWIMQVTQHIRLSVQQIMDRQEQPGGGLLKKAGWAALALAGLAVLSGALDSDEDAEAKAD